MTTHASPYGIATKWVVSANTWLVTCFGFVVYLSFLDDLYVIWRVSTQGSAFCESRWHNSPFRGSNPPNIPIFWVWIGIFKPKSRIVKVAYYWNYRIDSKQILHSDKDQQMPFVGGPNTCTTNSRWQTAAILEKSPYPGRTLTVILMKFGTVMQHNPPNLSDC